MNVSPANRTMPRQNASMKRLSDQQKLFLHWSSSYRFMLPNTDIVRDTSVGYPGVVCFLRMEMNNPLQAILCLWL
jgi:hypothetical protein